MKFLLAISIGPVQEFIAAARRTRDLTAGSKLLEAVAQAVAKSIKISGGELIFPASTEVPAANKILADLPVGVEPRRTAELARLAATQELLSQWERAQQGISSRYSVDLALAAAQIQSFLEVYCAWLPYSDDQYCDKRIEVDRLLAARKAHRDFAGPPEGLAPPAIKAKSPLDPAYECVFTAMPLTKRGETSNKDYLVGNPLVIGNTEYLDAISLLKRWNGSQIAPVPPSTNAMARRSWDPDYVEERYDDDEKAERYPYFATLHADGDKMGNMLAGLKSLEEHREFSIKLAKFAVEAKRIVEAHKGHAVYTGGDDVLALLPANRAINCARELSAVFLDILAPSKATLSAGIAIVHYQQPLQRSVAAARAAETAAKEGGRDSLCLAIHTRGGQPLVVTQNWKAWSDNYDTWAEAFRDHRVPRGVAYELKALARDFAGAAVPAGLIRKEVERIWKRKQNDSGDAIPDLPFDLPLTSVADLDIFANVLIAARFLSQEEI